MGQWREEDEQYGVRCCSPTECVTKLSCISNGVIYSKAVSICERNGYTLCTKAQILSEYCCGSGGDCNNRPVWTSTPEFDGKYL